MSAAHDEWDDAERQQEQVPQHEALLQRQRVWEAELEALRAERERLRVLSTAYVALFAGAPPAPRPAHQAGRSLMDQWADTYLRWLELHMDWLRQPPATAVALRSLDVDSRPTPGSWRAWASRAAGQIHSSRYDSAQHEH